MNEDTKKDLYDIGDIVVKGLVATAALLYIIGYFKK